MLSHEELKTLPITELRERWTKEWGIIPHRRISRPMLIRSLVFKHWEQESGQWTREMQKQLDRLVREYKRNPRCFDESHPRIKPGTRLVRIWQGKRHTVLVQESGFDYLGKTYGSLSEIAYTITGTRWNGWVFFGLKKKKANK